MKKVGRSRLVLNKILTEIKSILSNLCISRAAVTRRVVIAVKNSVLSTLCPEKMAQNGSSITLSTKWAQNVLKSLDCVKQRRTTSKKEMGPALYEELTFSWKRKIRQIVLEHNIHLKMILNF